MEWFLKTFNELSIRELYRILKARNEVFIVEQRCYYLDCDGNDEKAYHLFCKEDNEIIAYLRILEEGVTFDAVSIGRVMVDKKYRGKGLAKDIMLRAIDVIHNSLHGTEIKISAQVYLLDFYQSLGFIKISDGYLEDGIPHIDMQLTK